MVSELFTVWDVKPGHEAELRAACERLATTLKNAPVELNIRTGLRDERHVIFDGGTRMVWFTTFETDWDPYVEDAIVSIGIDNFTDWLQHTTAADDWQAWIREAGGREKLGTVRTARDAAHEKTAADEYRPGLKKFLMDHQVPAAGYYNAMSYHDPRRGQQGEAGERGVPAGAGQPRRRRGAPAPGPQAAAGAGGRLTLLIPGGPCWLEWRPAAGPPPLHPWPFLPALPGKERSPMSDHFSGPRALAGPAGDITDLYAFPSPERPGHLVLAMNVLPLARPDATFSDAIACRFRLRPLTIAGRADRRFPFGPRGVRSWSSPAASTRRGPAATAPRRCQDGAACRRPARPSASACDDEQGGRGAACASTPACARTRSSSTCRPTGVAEDRTARLQGRRDRTA